MAKTLFYQHVDFEVHRVSKDPERLYELIPGASTQLYNRDDVHPKETKYATRTVKINDLGFRDRERFKTKAQDVFRIIILGGSNTYGAVVNNEDTYPAILQRIFDNKHPGRVEVWNAGICAYVISQKVAYAEYIIKEFEPDLLIFQCGNHGRRAFHDRSNIKDLEKLFKQNKELYAENVPFLFSDKSPPIHSVLVSHLKLYRLIFIWVNTICVSRSKDLAKRLRFNSYASDINSQSFKNFIKKHSNMKIILFAPQGYFDIKNKSKNVAYLELDRANKPPEYSDIHPPSYVYKWYGRKLYKFLMTNNYIDFGIANDVRKRKDFDAQIVPTRSESPH